MRFLHLYLSRLKDFVLVPLMSGAANVSLSISKIKNIKIPLPSIEEQSRIVELFEKVAEEQISLELEITNQQSILKQLKQTILQEAIEGKLTSKWREQNSDIEPASILLEKIQAEKEKLIKDKKIKKQKPLQPITDDEKSFEIPQGWAWCRLGDTGFSLRGKSPKYDKYSNTYTINQKCVRWGYIDLTFSKMVKKDWFDSIDKFILTKDNDLVVNSTGEGTIGRNAIITKNEQNIIYDSHVLLYRTLLNESRYIMSTINSSYGQQQIEELKGAKSTKQTELGVEKLNNLLISLPPIKEQKEIVSIIEKFFAICDQLEEQINSSKENVDMLMKTVLKEAFEHGEG